MSKLRFADSRARPAPDPLSLHEIQIRLDEIVGIDPCNSRREGAGDLDGLSASLKARQLNPIIVRRARGGFSVLAGGRRWEASRLNALADDLEFHAVSLRARTFEGGDDEARLVSFEENYDRQSLGALDEAAAIADLAAAMTPQRLAARIGAPIRFVRQRLAIAALSPRVRELYAEGRINMRALEAFTENPLLAAQEALLDAPDAESVLRAPLEIKRRLDVGVIAATAPEAVFVGEAAYREAGGEVLEDLYFERRFADAGLVRRRAAEKLDAAAAALRGSEGWGFAVLPCDDIQVLRGPRPDYLEDEGKELAELRRGIVSLTPFLAADALERIEAIEARAALRAISAGDRQRFGVAVSIDSDGRLAIERGLIRIPIAGERSEPPADARAGDPPAAEGRGGTAAAARADHSDSRTAAAEDSRSPSSDACPPTLAPLALRIAQTAASRALGDLCAIDPDFALRLLIASFLPPGTLFEALARVRREQGPWSVAGRDWVAIAREDFAGRLAWLRGKPAADLMRILAEIVAASIDLRGSSPEAAAALLAEQQPHPLRLAEAIAENFDPAAFFRAASPAIALAAIGEIAGAETERGHAWRDPDSLATKAAGLAKASGWIPDCVRPAGAARATGEGLGALRACRACGCTDERACEPFGCSWVAEDLCSACVPAGGESIAASGVP
jgi:ParB family chromosome partitioning protein